MALPSSGALSLLDIQGEFGGSNPIGINEYYGVASGIPASGQISIDDFYGASAAPTLSYVTTVGNDNTGSAANSLGTVSLGATAANRYTIICVGAIANSSFTATIGGLSCTSIAQVKFSGDDSYVGILICNTSSLGTSANITIDNDTYINRPGVSVYRVVNLSSASAYSTSTDNSGTALSCSASAPAGSIAVGIFFQKDNLPGTISFSNFATSANDGSYSSGGGTKYRVGSGTISSAATVTMSSTAGATNACAAMAVFK
jgi:hypothetical protein